MREDRDETTTDAPVFESLSWPEQQPGAERERGSARISKAPAGPPDALRVLTVVWLIVCAVQVAAWAMIDIIRWELTFPWWLWSVGAGAVIIGILRWTTGSVGRNRPESTP
jgi:hypothetical protein